MQRSRASQVAAVVAPAIAIFVLGNSCRSAAQPSPPAAATRPAGSVVDGPWTAISCGSDAVFVPAAMNAKLAYYPDFAAAAKLTSVSDCDGARTFASAYSVYAAVHPGFDLNQPLGTKSPTGARPLMPPLRKAGVEVAKIYQGIQTGTEPAVVQLVSA